jgi:hypothetical protein
MILLLLICDVFINSSTNRWCLDKIFVSLLVALKKAKADFEFCTTYTAKYNSVE